MGFSDIENLKPFEIKEFTFNNSRLAVARVGFTADLGYELWFEPTLNKDVERAITAAETDLGVDIKGYGLTALNALRLEGGFIVPGWDTAQTFEDNQYERTPMELGLSWVVDLDQEADFMGKDALLRQRETGPRFDIMGFTVERECDLVEGIDLYARVDGHAAKVGTCPSVAWSYGMSCWLGLASVQTDFFKMDLDYYLQVGGQDVECSRAKIPYVNFDRYRRVPAPL